MIRYALVCAERHEFESWFANSAAYDKQEKQKLVACPVCGTTKVKKALMTPRVAAVGRRATELREASQVAPEAGPASTDGAPAAGDAGAGTAVAPPVPAKPVAMLSQQEQEIRRKLKELRDHLVKNAENVGSRFPEEARKMHYRETEHRSIYGIASPEEAKTLSEEGIEFSPLPILPDEHN